MSKDNNSDAQLSDSANDDDNTIISENINESNNSKIDLNGFGDDLIENMPDVQNHVVESHLAEKEQIKNENATVRDKRNDCFNSEIHATEPDGSPKYTTSGYFAKKRGRKAGTVNSTLSAPNQAKAPDENTIRLAKQKAAGSAAANSLIMLGVVLGGSEWQPIKNEQLGLDEKSNLESAFSDYFTATGMDDIPAGWALTIAIMGYTLPRFTMPQTQQRSSKVITWIKTKWANRKLKKHGLEAKAAESKESK